MSSWKPGDHLARSWLSTGDSVGWLTCVHLRCWSFLVVGMFLVRMVVHFWVSMPVEHWGHVVRSMSWRVWKSWMREVAQMLEHA